MCWKIWCNWNLVKFWNFEGNWTGLSTTNCDRFGPGCWSRAHSPASYWTGGEKEEEARVTCDGDAAVSLHAPARTTPCAGVHAWRWAWWWWRGAVLMDGWILSRPQQLRDSMASRAHRQAGSDDYLSPSAGVGRIRSFGIREFGIIYCAFRCSKEDDNWWFEDADAQGLNIIIPAIQKQMHVCCSGNEFSTFTLLGYAATLVNDFMSAVVTVMLSGNYR